VALAPVLQAARAYDTAARAIRGVAAICNFPDPDDSRVMMSGWGDEGTQVATQNRLKRPTRAAAKHPGARKLFHTAAAFDGDEGEEMRGSMACEDIEMPPAKLGADRSETVAALPGAPGAPPARPLAPSVPSQPPRHVMARAARKTNRLPLAMRAPPATLASCDDSAKSDDDMLIDSSLFDSMTVDLFSGTSAMLEAKWDELEAAACGSALGTSGVLLEEGVLAGSPLVMGSWGAALAAASGLRSGSRPGSLGSLAVSPALGSLLGDGAGWLAPSMMRSQLDPEPLLGAANDVGDAQLLLDMELGACSPATAVMFDCS